MYMNMLRKECFLPYQWIRHFFLIFFSPSIEVNFEWYHATLSQGGTVQVKKITHGCFVRAASMLNSGDHRKCVSRKASPAALRSSLKPRVSLSERDSAMSASRAPILLPRSLLQTKWRPLDFISLPIPFPSLFLEINPSHDVQAIFLRLVYSQAPTFTRASPDPRPPHIPHCLLREGTFCIVQGPMGRLLPSLCADLERPVDRALVAQVTPGYLF